MIPGLNKDVFDQVTPEERMEVELNERIASGELADIPEHELTYHEQMAKL